VYEVTNPHARPGGLITDWRYSRPGGEPIELEEISPTVGETTDAETAKPFDLLVELGALRRLDGIPG
jgi:hypothetical protein